ncbi:hypothetical protein SNK04_002357 [Fusarium graminearum]
MADRRPSGPPDPPDPKRSQKKDPPAEPAPSPQAPHQTGIRDFFKSSTTSIPSERTPSRQRAPSSTSSSGRGIQSFFQPTSTPAPSQQRAHSGGALPASSSRPDLNRDDSVRRSDVPQGRPRAPTVESLASGMGSLTTLPSSGSHSRLPTDRPIGSPQPLRSRANTLSSQPSVHGSPRPIPGSPLVPRSTAPTPGSPSLGRGRGSPLVPSATTSGSPSGPYRGSPSRPPPGSPSGPPPLPPPSSWPPVRTSSPDPIVCRAFEVIRALSHVDAQLLNRDVRRGFFRLDLGDIGEIPKLTDNFIDGNLAPYVQVDSFAVTAKSEQLGAFMKKRVDVVETQSIQPSLQTAQLSLPRSLSNITPLQAFLERLLISLSEVGTQAKLKLYGVPEITAAILLEGSKCRTFVDQFIHGMKKLGSLDLFQDGLPSLSRVWHELEHVDPNVSTQFTDVGTYFYVLIYYNEKTGAMSIYVGRTVNPLARHKQHTKSLFEGGQLLHYVVARKKIREGATHRLIPIAFLPNRIPDADLFQSWGETILAVLFGSFSPIMLNARPPSSSSEFTQNDLASLGQSLERDTYLKTCGAPLANLLQNAATRIKNSDSSLKPFDSSERFTGLNWSVPLVECAGVKENLWVRTTTHANSDRPAVWTFRTHPRRLTKERFITIFNAPIGCYPIRFRPLTPEYCTSLVAGSVVNVVVEITIDPTQRHPYAYSRMPAVGSFDCWDQAFRLAIRIEFEDAGKWKTVYLRQENIYVFATKIKAMKTSQFGEELNHIELSWCHSIKIMAALLNWEWTPTTDILAQRVWVPYFNRLRVTHYDFLNQCLVVSDSESTTKQVPRLLTLDETARNIEEKFGHDVNIGNMPGLALINVSGSSIRTKCDLCLMGDRGGKMTSLARYCKNRVVIKTVDGQKLWQCPFSKLLNRYCTFTYGIENRRDLHDLVYMVGQADYPVQTIETPPNVFQFLEVREKLEQEPVDKDDKEF